MRWRKVLTGIAFAVYSLVMLWLLFGQRMGDTLDGNYLENLQSMPLPFQTIVQFVNIIVSGDPIHLVPHAWQNLIGNVVMFVPIGVFVPCFFARCRTWKTMLLWGLAIIAAVELTQFFTLLGSLDFDDFLLNMIGITGGFALWQKFSRKFLDNHV